MRPWRKYWSALCILLVLASCRQETYYSISTDVQPEGSGSIEVSTQSDRVLSGTAVTFKATPGSGYAFDGWGESLSGTENPKTITITSDVDIVACFKLAAYPLTVSVEGEGTVNERIVGTASEYGTGTVVELTAEPADHWVFDHWEGDLSGPGNPARINVSEAKSVTAVFIRSKYAYSLKIIGPGAVDEYPVSWTKADYESGTKILLKAYPSENAVFKGWSGDLNGSDAEITVEMDKEYNIVAEFVGKDILSTPLADITQPSGTLDFLYDGIDLNPYVQSGSSYVMLDYNRDGHLDLITTQVFYDGMQARRQPIRFYLGNSEGCFVPDEENDSKFLSIDTRKFLYGDFNGDGFPDIFILGHGYDAEPWPGEYPMVLISKDGPTYSEFRFTDYVSFFHGGATGDIDADGDLDVFLTASWQGGAYFFINDGHGNFDVRTDLIDQGLLPGMYTCEIFDIDHDGFVDLFLGGHDSEGPYDYSEGDDEYQNTPIAFWGNGKTYDSDDYVRLPKPPVSYGVALDYYFYDLNSDGSEEIIVVRTTDGAKGRVFYNGWKLQVIQREGRSFQDVTDTYFEDGCDRGTGFWIDKVCIQDIAGTKYLLAQTTLGSNPVRLFSFSNKHFHKLEDESLRKENGFAISHTVSNTISQGWELYTSLVYPFEQGIDLTSLVENDYVLEFYLSNTDPSLRFDIHFDTSERNANGEILMYGGAPDFESLKHDGTWERIRIPLKNIELWDDSDNNCWDKVSQFVIITTSTGGTEFSVKDIRIRKVLPE